jgi:hypothetical protein
VERERGRDDTVDFLWFCSLYLVVVAITNFGKSCTLLFSMLEGINNGQEREMEKDLLSSYGLLSSIRIKSPIFLCYKNIACHLNSFLR